MGEEVDRTSDLSNALQRPPRRGAGRGHRPRLRPLRTRNGAPLDYANRSLAHGLRCQRDLDWRCGDCGSDCRTRVRALSFGRLICSKHGGRSALRHRLWPECDAYYVPRGIPGSCNRRGASCHIWTESLGARLTRQCASRVPLLACPRAFGNWASSAVAKRSEPRTPLSEPSMAFGDFAARSSSSSRAGMRKLLPPLWLRRYREIPESL